MFKKALVVAVLATATVLALPFAAVAADPYVDPAKVQTSDSTPAPGEPVTITFTDLAFDSLEPVTGTVDADSPATIAIIKTAVQGSVTKTSSATGAVAFTVTGAAAGSYRVTATGQTSGTVGVATFTVVAADAATGSGSGLPNTGAEIPTLAIWVGGGALALGVALVLVMTISRRRSNNAA
ncbi:MAG: LPXTG cell wall anchor domain-containing protein [Rhodoglobus sp.]